MSAPATICLTMIVKDDMANLGRCLSSVADHIGCWVIGDAGSTDGTPDFIRTFFARRGLPGGLYSASLTDPEQAQEAALQRACATRLAFDYLLLADADMELVVEDPEFRARLEAPGYALAQRSGIRYWDARIVRRDDAARRPGVNPADPDVSGGGRQLRGVWCLDHAAAADRVKKCERHIRMLVRSLGREPKNSRHWFALGQLLSNAGFVAEAAKTYAKRAEMEPLDEEGWYARLQEARCLLTLKDEAGFLRAAMVAFNQRPQRAEPLYDLARFYREHGMTNASLLYAEAGLALEWPGRDTLFYEDFVYRVGLREEYSIAGYYSSDPVRKQRGHAAAEWLALTRDAPPAARELARSNLSHYCEPARTLMPSFSARKTGFTPPDGWTATNPSIARGGDQTVMVMQCINYPPGENGEHRSVEGSPIATRNFLLRMNADLKVGSVAEILPPLDLPASLFDQVQGFANVRPFVWRGELWCCATLRELNPEGCCEQVLARIDVSRSGTAQMSDWCVLRPEGPRQHEQNWMPLVAGDDLRFIRSCDPTRVVDEQAHTVAKTVPPLAAELFGGGSQAIGFDRGWLALVHEAGERDGKRSYWHRFVWLDAEFALRGLSRRFYLDQPGAEFVCGLAWHPDGERLLISYGTKNCEAWFATVDGQDVRAILAHTDALTATDMGKETPWQLVPAPDFASPARRHRRLALPWATAA